ncbi:serine/threonine protein kinase [Pseudofrankia sp. BMG5.36]|nr:serine/threonine protein kinase [Pseudofrankia sp. BMG5.36]
MGLPDVAPPGPDDPDLVGPYRVLGVLGKGGMGTVYLARRAGRAEPGASGTAHTHSRGGGAGWDAAPLVAVKVIDEDLARVPAFRERFRREAHAARKVARFCTAEVLDVDVSGPRPYLVTEFIDGPTLATAVTGWGPLPPAELERFAVAVASALTAIHAAGVIHRDLKPGNIMLSSSGARVIDFGVCRPLTDATAITVGKLGTPVFMSPEQALDQPSTTATDVHAWGGNVVYAASGRLPFGEPGITELLRRVVCEAPDLAGLPPALRQVVARAMAKNPADRPTARELLLWLTDATAPDPTGEATLRLPAGSALLPLPPTPFPTPTPTVPPAPAPAPANRYPAPPNGYPPPPGPPARVPRTPPPPEPGARPWTRLLRGLWPPRA